MRAKARKTTKADETPEFVEFWDRIWRKHARETDGRGDARDEFFRHVESGTDAQDIVDGARCFIRKMSAKGYDYIPLAASWLNKRAYEDLCDEEREYQKRIQEALLRRAANVVPMRETAAAFIPQERRSEAVARARALMRGKGGEEL